MKYILLGDYDHQGVYTDPLIRSGSLSGPVLDTLVADSQRFLPERVRVTDYEWLKDNIIVITADEGAEATMTFIDEGAGYKNTIIVAVIPPSYGGEIDRETIDQVAQLYIMWPNLSKPHVVAGETLNIPKFITDPSRMVHVSGDLYRMVGPLSASERVLEVGTRVIFGLIPNGWKSTSIDLFNTPFFSQNNLNVETFKNKFVIDRINAHTVLIQSSLPGYSILGFEDLRRDRKGCDNDFNDAVFVFNVSSSAIDWENSITSVRGVSFVEDDNEPPTQPDKFDVGYKKVLYKYTPPGASSPVDVECIARLLIPKDGTKCRNGSDLPSPKPPSGKSTVVICTDEQENSKTRTDYLFCHSIKVLKIPPGVTGLRIGQKITGSAHSFRDSSFLWSNNTWMHEPALNKTDKHLCSVPGLHYFSDRESAVNFK
jgi:hypothetical protein